MVNLLAALVGGSVDRGDGDSGIKGAIVGATAAKVILPLAAIAVGAAAARYVLRPRTRSRINLFPAAA